MILTLLALSGCNDNNNNTEIEKAKSDSTFEQVAESERAVEKWNELIGNFRSDAITDEPEIEDLFGKWTDYESESVKLNKHINGSNCFDLGSMYIPIACGHNELKHELFYTSLVFLNPNAKFKNEEYDSKLNQTEYSSEIFEFGKSELYEEQIRNDNLESISNEELKEKIKNIANKLNDEFNYDFTSYVNSFISYEESMFRYEEYMDAEIDTKASEKKRLENVYIELLSLSCMK